MPSLFSRARTASTPSKSKHKQPPPTLSTNPLPTFSSALLTGSPTVRTPVDEFDVHHLARSRSVGGAGASAPGEAGYGAVGFLPTTLPADPHTPWASSPSAPPLGLSSSTSSSNSHKDPHQLFGGPIQPRAAYGLLSPARDAVLGLADAARLVGTVCAELERTGVATPFVFSVLALDVRRAGVIRLVNAFLATCRDSSASSPSASHSHNGNNGRVEEKWLEEARFAGPHELGMCLCWCLSQVVRVEGGREVRDLLSRAWYERWRVDEGGECSSFLSFTLSFFLLFRWRTWGRAETGRVVLWIQFLTQGACPTAYQLISRRCL
jgi:hypothetical protein